VTNTRLERDYERALRWYPERWRRTHGPAMLGTLLDVADGDGRTRPVAGELADLRWRGLRERVNGVVPADVRALAASIGTGAAAGFALVHLLWVSWGPWDARPLTPLAGWSTFGPFHDAGVLFTVPFLLGAVAAALGSRIAAHVSVLVGLSALPVLMLLVRSDDSWAGPRSTTLGCAALLGLVTLVGDPRHRRALGAAFALVGGLFAGLAFLQPTSGNGLQVRSVADQGFWMFIASPWAIASAGLAVAVVVVGLLVLRRAGAAAAVAIAWLPWGVVTTYTLLRSSEDPADAVIVMAVSVALVVGAVGAARRRNPALQRRRTIPL
jgi:hypothetical protein